MDTCPWHKAFSNSLQSPCQLVQIQQIIWMSHVKLIPSSYNIFLSSRQVDLYTQLLSMWNQPSTCLKPSGHWPTVKHLKVCLYLCNFIHLLYDLSWIILSYNQSNERGRDRDIPMDKNHDFFFSRGTSFDFIRFSCQFLVKIL